MSDFHYFPQLPAELQKEIWRWCLPHRVHELDTTLPGIVFGLAKDAVPPSPCTLDHTSLMNKCPPLITRVCRDSRSVAFETGSVPNSLPQDNPEGSIWESYYLNNDAWADRARDSAHLNYTEAYDGEFQSYGNPLGYLAYEAQKLSGDASFMVQKFIGNPSVLAHWSPWNPLERSDLPPLDGDNLEEFEALERRTSWLVVMRTVIVHTDISVAAETGLFGLLGDARIQIVELSDEARIRAFFELAETCETSSPFIAPQHFVPVFVPQNFSRESEAALTQYFKEDLLLTYHSEKLVAAMRPAIMFRLCTQMCNHQ